MTKQASQADKGNKTNPVCFFDICTQDYDTGKIQLLGRILMELRQDVVPLTTENFRKLCTGEALDPLSGTSMYYKNCSFHRVISGFCSQSGDFTKGDGTGGHSIYGPTFKDENFVLKHELYALAMANSKKDTNSSQFYFFHGNNPSHLNNKHVVFGKVIFGFDICDTINSMGSIDGNTTSHIYIARCGQLHTDQAVEILSRFAQEQTEKLILASTEL